MKKYSLHRYSDFYKEDNSRIVENYDYYLKKKDGSKTKVTKDAFVDKGSKYALDRDRVNVDIINRTVTGMFESSSGTDGWEDYLSLSYDDFLSATKDRYEDREWLDQSKMKKTPSVVNIRTEGMELVPLGSHICLEKTLSIIEPDMVVQVIGDTSEAMDKNRMVVVDSKYILFGRENWMAAMMLNPSFKCPIINLPANVKGAENATKIGILLPFSEYGNVPMESVPAYDILKMDEEQLKEGVKKILTEKKDLVERMRTVYAENDLRLIIMNYVISQGKKAISRKVMENYRTTTQNLERLDENAVTDTAEYVAMFAGVLDPTPTTDLVSSGLYFARGEYMLGTLALVSAVPYVGDLVAKPIMMLIKGAIRNKVVKKTMPIISKAIKDLDTKGLMKAVETLPDGKLKETLVSFFQKAGEWLPKLTTFLSDLTKKIGEKWDKVKWLYMLTKGWVGVNIFSQFADMWERFKEKLTKLSEEDVYGILVSNISYVLKKTRKLENDFKVNRRMSLPDIWKLPEDEFREDSNYRGIPIRIDMRLKDGRLNLSHVKR